MSFLGKALFAVQGWSPEHVVIVLHIIHGEQLVHLQSKIPCQDTQ